MKNVIDDKKLNELHDKGRGFILNDFSGEGLSGMKYNVLHKASCTQILKSNTNVEKMFFDNEIEARRWLEENRKSNWKSCWFCLRNG